MTSAFDEPTPRYDLDPRDHDGEQYDLEDRQALRRVAGLSTELAGRHRGRVPPAAAGARRARRCLDRGHARATPRTRSPSWPRSPRRPAPQVLEALIQRRDRPDPATYVGSGKARELRDIVVVDRRRHRDLRRRADPRPAAPARGRRQGQGHRPHRADPRHLRPARQEPGGQGAGVAGPDAVHAAAAARLGRVDVPAGRWRAAGRRPAASAPAAPARRRSRPTAGASAPGWPSCAARSPAMKTARDTKRQERRRNEVPSVAIAGYTNAGKSIAAQPAHRRRRARRERAVRHPRPDRAPGRRPPTAATTRSPTPSASSGTCRTSWSRRSARRWRRSPTPT